MNEPLDALPEPGDDPEFDELIAPLKRLEPPLETRVANRVAVAAELRALGNANRQRRLPWWRRSISIPLPIAASVALLAAFALPSSFRGWQNRPPTHAEAPNQLANDAAEARGAKMVIATRTPIGGAVLKHYETETYLCGVGRVSSESRYSIKE